MANSHTSTVLAAILHRLSVSVEQSRVYAESRAIEADQYRCVNRNLKAQLDEKEAHQQALQEMVETQKKVIEVLEQELAQTSQRLTGSPAQILEPQFVSPSAEPPPRERSKPQTNDMGSQSGRPAPPIEADELALRRQAKRRRTEEDDVSVDNSRFIIHY
ncbi:hypothetical protein BGZ63DRAFT_171453 [Mariannaea sp. PMI_226]|nr:hypothetical protein BGZ63DRAFT_171453 [Mariannaea sp. PMI_226]